MLLSIYRSTGLSILFATAAFLLFGAFCESLVLDARAQSVGTTAPSVVEAEKSWVPSPFSDLMVKDFSMPSLGLVQLAEASQERNQNRAKVALEIRTLTLSAGQQLNITDVIKPGSFEVHMGALPKIDGLATAGKRKSNLLSSATIRTGISSTEFAISTERSHRPQTTILARLDSAGIQRLTRLGRDGSGLELEQAPTCKGYSGEVTTYSDFSQRPFVVGVEPKIENSIVGYQPKIQLVEEGLVFQFLPEIKGEQISLKADILLSKITDVQSQPLPALGSGDEPMSIQVPEQKISSVHLSALLENGETLYIDPQHANMTARTKTNMLRKNKAVLVKQRICYLITARIVDGETSGSKSQYTARQEALK